MFDKAAAFQLPADSSENTLGCRDNDERASTSEPRRASLVMHSRRVPRMQSIPALSAFQSIPIATQTQRPGHPATHLGCLDRLHTPDEMNFSSCFFSFFACLHADFSAGYQRCRKDVELLSAP